MKIARWSIGLLLMLPLGLSAAAQQGDQQSTPQPAANSVVEASHRAREQKKDQAKAVHVWNDDNLPKAAEVSVVGQTPVADNAPGSATAPSGGATPVAAPGPSAADLAAVTAELTTAKERLQSIQKDLDILQRKYGLDEQTYLSKPEYKNDREGGAQLKGEQSQIEALQAEILEAQKKVDLLQSKLAGSSPANSK